MLAIPFDRGVVGRLEQNLQSRSDLLPQMLDQHGQIALPASLAPMIAKIRLRNWPMVRGSSVWQ